MDSIIFDVDGTLWDAVNNKNLCWTETAAKYGYIINTTYEDIRSMMGWSAEAIATVLFPQLSPEKALEIFLIGCHDELDYLRSGRPFFPKTYEKVPETIRTLSSKYKIGIVSNCREGYIETFLDMNNLNDCVNDHLCSGDTNLNKAENITLLMQRNNLNTPWYVGDTKGDLASCRNAGIPFIYASYGFGKVRDYDARIDAPYDLVALADTL